MFLLAGSAHSGHESIASKRYHKLLIKNQQERQKEEDNKKKQVDQKTKIVEEASKLNPEERFRKAVERTMVDIQREGKAKGKGRNSTGKGKSKGKGKNNADNGKRLRLRESLDGVQ